MEVNEVFILEDLSSQAILQPWDLDTTPMMPTSIADKSYASMEHRWIACARHYLPKLWKDYKELSACLNQRVDADRRQKRKYDLAIEALELIASGKRRDEYAPEIAEKALEKIKKDVA